MPTTHKHKFIMRPYLYRGNVIAFKNSGMNTEESPLTHPRTLLPKLHHFLTKTYLYCTSAFNNHLLTKPLSEALSNSVSLTKSIPNYPYQLQLLPTSTIHSHTPQMSNPTGKPTNAGTTQELSDHRKFTTLDPSKLEEDSRSRGLESTKEDPKWPLIKRGLMASLANLSHF